MSTNKRTAYPKSHFKPLTHARYEAARRAQEDASFYSADDREQYEFDAGRKFSHPLTSTEQDLSREKYELARLLLGIDE